MRQFITNMLNIQEDKIEELQTIAQSDGSIIINLKLKVTSKICPFCSGPVKIHGYYPRTLTHSTLVNRKCSIVYPVVPSVLILLTNLIPLLKPMTD